MPVVVFLHAFPLHRGMWQPQVTALPAGWTAYAPDFRGFGDAPAESERRGRSGDASLDDFATDVIAGMDARGIDRAVFCGCSMGGYIALALLRRYPGRASGLVLADTRATADSEQGRVSRHAMLDLLEREGPAAIAAQMLPRLVARSTHERRPEVVDAVARMASQATADGIKAAVVGMMNRPDSSAVLAAFRGPVLVVVGAEDELTPVAESEAMAAMVPGSRLAVIPGAGHLSNLESPAAFNAALCAFLNARCAAPCEPKVASPEPRAPSPESCP